MSLNRSERSDTRAELHANLDRSGLGVDAVAQTLGWPEPRVAAALDVAGASPRDVWLVRDLLDRTIRAAGEIPHAWSTLTEQMRSAAESWFGLYNLDEILDGAPR